MIDGEELTATRMIRELTDPERQYGELLARCLKAEAERDRAVTLTAMLRQELSWESEASEKMQRDLRRDMIRTESALQAAAKRNETIARLASELGETHRDLQRATADAKNERANAARNLKLEQLWQDRATESMAFANEAMAAGLAECARLRDELEEACLAFDDI